ncbi:hypothetical protein GE061_012572, partial [Apolygus lucorum]
PINYVGLTALITRQFRGRITRFFLNLHTIMIQISWHINGQLIGFYRRSRLT